MSRFKKATRHQLRLRMALFGPSGSGKTYTALRFAFALAAMEGGRVALIDTEREAASKYAGYEIDGQPWDFDSDALSNFAPTEYTSAIQAAGKEGYSVLIIDSLSHAWAGEGGALDLKDRQGGNEFTAWRNVTPMHNRMVDAILQSPCHVIATMRSKTQYVLEANDRGKMVPRKVGMEPIQRAGMEYEFDITGSLECDTNILKIDKSRCPAVAGWVGPKPTASFMEPVIAWLKDGVAVEPVVKASQEQFERVAELFKVLKIDNETARRGIKKRFGVDDFFQLSAEKAAELEMSLRDKVAQQAEAAALAASNNKGGGQDSGESSAATVATSANVSQAVPDKTS